MGRVAVQTVLKTAGGGLQTKGRAATRACSCLRQQHARWTSRVLIRKGHAVQRGMSFCGISLRNSVEATLPVLASVMSPSHLVSFNRRSFPCLKTPYFIMKLGDLKVSHYAKVSVF